MGDFQKYEVFLSPGQIKSLSNALKNSTAVNIRVSKESLKKNPNTDLMITKTQKKRIDKAERCNTGLVLKMSKTQVAANKKALKGGILPLLASIGIPILTGVATNLISEGLSGNGLALPGTSGGVLTPSRDNRIPDSSTSGDSGEPPKHVKLPKPGKGIKTSMQSTTPEKAHDVSGFGMEQVIPEDLQVTGGQMELLEFLRSQGKALTPELKVVDLTPVHTVVQQQSVLQQMQSPLQQVPVDMSHQADKAEIIQQALEAVQQSFQQPLQQMAQTAQVLQQAGQDLLSQQQSLMDAQEDVITQQQIQQEVGQTTRQVTEQAREALRQMDRAQNQAQAQAVLQQAGSPTGQGLSLPGGGLTLPGQGLTLPGTKPASLRRRPRRRAVQKKA